MASEQVTQSASFVVPVEVAAELVDEGVFEYRFRGVRAPADMWPTIIVAVTSTVATVVAKQLGEESIRALIRKLRAWHRTRQDATEVALSDLNVRLELSATTTTAITLSADSHVDTLVESLLQQLTQPKQDRVASDGHEP